MFGSMPDDLWGANVLLLYLLIVLYDYNIHRSV